MSHNLLNLTGSTEQDILDLIELANSFKSGDLNEYRHENLFPDKKVASFFSEPSTRTKLSFEIAAYNLGAKFLDFNIENSSIQKGEITYMLSHSNRGICCRHRCYIKNCIRQSNCVNIAGQVLVNNKLQRHICLFTSR